MENQRVRLTKTIIENTFISLLKEKKIEKITVKEICEKAQINRSTFYAYYLDQYDLLDSLQKKVSDIIIDYIMDHTDSIFDESSLTGVLRTLKDKKDGINIFINGNGCYNFNRNLIIREYDAIKATRIMPDNIDFYSNSFYMVGFYSIIQCWMENDCIVNEKEIARLIINLAKKNNIYYYLMKNK